MYEDFIKSSQAYNVTIMRIIASNGSTYSSSPECNPKSALCNYIFSFILIYKIFDI